MRAPQDSFFRRENPYRMKLAKPDEMKRSEHDKWAGCIMELEGPGQNVEPRRFDYLIGLEVPAHWAVTDRWTGL